MENTVRLKVSQEKNRMTQTLIVCDDYKYVDELMTKLNPKILVPCTCFYIGFEDGPSYNNIFTSVDQNFKDMNLLTINIKLAIAKGSKHIFYVIPSENKNLSILRMGFEMSMKNNGVSTHFIEVGTFPFQFYRSLQIRGVIRAKMKDVKI